MSDPGENLASEDPWAMQWNPFTNPPLSTTANEPFFRHTSFFPPRNLRSKDVCWRLGKNARFFGGIKPTEDMRAPANKKLSLVIEHSFEPAPGRGTTCDLWHQNQKSRGLCMHAGMSWFLRLGSVWTLQRRDGSIDSYVGYLPVQVTNLHSANYRYW